MGLKGKKLVAASSCRSCLEWFEFLSFLQILKIASIVLGLSGEVSSRSLLFHRTETLFLRQAQHLHSASTTDTLIASSSNLQVGVRLAIYQN